MDDFDLATEERLDALADRLWARIVGVQFNPIELNLRPRTSPFGCDDSIVRTRQNEHRRNRRLYRGAI